MPRRKDLTPLRDKRIVEVYHQLSDIERMKSEDVLMIMEQKMFFIDAAYIYKLIFYNKKNRAYYDELLSGANIERAIQKKIGKHSVNQLNLGL